MSESVCAITGYSPNRFSFGFDEENSNYKRLMLTIINEISNLIDSGITEFLSGMDLGVDTWGAGIVLSMRDQGSAIRLMTVLPCETQAAKWSAGDRSRYYDILEKADDEYYISSHYTATCMNDRNRYLVDHANVLLAVYDGKPWGDTAQTVNYAHQQGKSILTIDPDTFRVKPYMVVIRGRQ